jgi:hypothetical protein
MLNGTGLGAELCDYYSALVKDNPESLICNPWLHYEF